MKTQLRLNSVIPHGVGSSSESILIDVIYAYLLREYGQNVYSVIGINQIGDDLNELIMKKPGNHIHINIRYPAVRDFDAKGEQEKNRLRLDVAHTALLRIAEYDKKLDPVKLEAIRSRILAHDFSFEFVRKVYINKKNEDLKVNVVVHPTMTECNYYVLVQKQGKETCRMCIYRGQPVSVYDYNNFFGTGKWKGADELVLTGKLNEVETHIKVGSCVMEVVNLTLFERPPQYTLMQAGISEQQRKISRNDFEQSLPPESREVLKKAGLLGEG